MSGAEGFLENCRGLLSSLARPVLVVHHWDVDGIASAALVARSLGFGPTGVLETRVPSIGEYRVDAIPRPPSGARGLLVLDYGLPGPEYRGLVEEMESRGTKVLVVDHHRVEYGGWWHCNPVAAGIGGEDEYPSCSLLAYRVLRRGDLGGGLGEEGVGDVLLAVLGVVGDLYPYMSSGIGHPGLRTAEPLLRVLERAGVEREKLLDAADALDSCYRVLDENCIAGAVRAGARDPFSLLEYRPALSNRERVEETVEKLVEKALEEAVEGKDYVVYHVETDMPLTGAVGRRLASMARGRVAVLLHVQPGRRRILLYARSPGAEHLLEKLRRGLKSQGLEVRGKESVVVVQLPLAQGEGLEEGLERARSLVEKAMRG